MRRRQSDLILPGIYSNDFTGQPAMTTFCNGSILHRPIYAALAGNAFRSQCDMNEIKLLKESWFHTYHPFDSKGYNALGIKKKKKMQYDSNLTQHIHKQNVKKKYREESLKMTRIIQIIFKNPLLIQTTFQFKSTLMSPASGLQSFITNILTFDSIRRYRHFPLGPIISLAMYSKRLSLLAMLTSTETSLLWLRSHS